MTRILRILIAGCEQEISSFNPVPSRYDLFEVRRGMEVLEAKCGKNTTIGGAAAEFESGGPVELVPTYHAQASSAGPLAHDSFGRIAEEFLGSIEPHAGKIDGVYFSMHGAMATTEELDPEGYLLSLARGILGPEVPIVISLDLHGILTARMLEQVNAVASYFTYPHVDFADTGRRAAKILMRILEEESHPVTARVRVPALVRGDELITESGLFGEQIRYARNLHDHPRVLSAGFLIGNPFTDVPELCSQAFVVTNDDPALARESALEMAQDFWQNRERMQGKFVGLEDAIARGAVMTGPVAFTDAADAPSSGASGDSNAIISEMLGQSYPHSVLAPLVDPPAAAKAHALGVGAKFRMPVGGALDPRFEPLELELTVESIANGPVALENWAFVQETGPMAVLRSDHLTLVVTTHPVMLVDRALFLASGNDPRGFHSTIVKSPHCEPQFYDDWVEANFNVDAPGSTSANLKTLGHRICARPMYPLDQEVRFEPEAEIYRNP